LTAAFPASAGIDTLSNIRIWFSSFKPEFPFLVFALREMYTRAPLNAGPVESSVRIAIFQEFC